LRKIYIYQSQIIIDLCINERFLEKEKTTILNQRRKNTRKEFIQYSAWDFERHRK
jgi:hypothetical protein